MTRSLKDIYDYEQEALKAIQKHYPKYDRKELESLLIEQINDELRDYSNCRTNQRAGRTREGSDKSRT